VALNAQRASQTQDENAGDGVLFRRLQLDGGNVRMSMRALAFQTFLEKALLPPRGQAALMSSGDVAKSSPNDFDRHRTEALNKCPDP
jgi:hypothetical protein